jgi:gliding motility-associated-like protein
VQEFDFIITALQPPTIDYLVNADFEPNQTLTVAANGGSGQFLYSFNGFPFQNNPVFSAADGGDVLVKVKDENGCYDFSTIITLWNYPRFFTPNGDGFNDTWGIRTQKPISIDIFDRYGKLLKQLKTSNRWDGTFNGQLLPINDYWFVIYYNDKMFKSHFALKR